MRLFVLISLISLGLTAVAGHKLLYKSLSSLNEKDADDSIHWVLLVAGSKGWGNYRHQADVSHAYQIIRKHGIPAEHIVTMMYDDVANSNKNPFPGRLFNRPGGPDVYEGVVVDYSRRDVNPQNFLAILRGDEKAMKGIGSGKVIKSGPKDRIFLNFADHGGVGVLCFPDKTLEANTFMEAIQQMHADRKYKEMVMYIEACESGSMFENLLPEDINVLAVTAANAHEPSYAAYFDKRVGAFLGDVFSISWMEDSDKTDMSQGKLHDQYLRVKKRSTKSHAMEYGTKKIGRETLNNFQGELKAVVNKAPSNTEHHDVSDAVRSEDVPLATLYRKLQSTNDREKTAEINSQIKELIKEKTFVEKTIRKIVDRVSAQTNHLFEDLFDSSHQLKSHACYFEVLHVYKEHCFDITKNGYALRSLGKLVNMCESNIHPRVISDAIRSTCTYSTPVEDVHHYD